MSTPVQYRCAVCGERQLIGQAAQHERKHTRHQLRQADLEQRKLSGDATPDNARDFM